MTKTADEKPGLQTVCTVPLSKAPILDRAHVGALQLDNSALKIIFLTILIRNTQMEVNARLPLLWEGEEEEERSGAV